MCNINNRIKLCSVFREEKLNFFFQIPILNRHIINSHMSNHYQTIYHAGVASETIILSRTEIMQLVDYEDKLHRADSLLVKSVIKTN